MTVSGAFHRTVGSRGLSFFYTCLLLSVMIKQRNFNDAPHLGRDFLKDFQDVPRKSTIFFKFFRMLRTGARFHSNFSGYSARKRVFFFFKFNFQDASHGCAICFKIFRMLRARARFSFKFSGCSARERDFLQKFQDAPHGRTCSFNQDVREQSILV